MNITEHKLRIENERYKIALENILDGAPPRTLAEAALNPAPPAPVTLADILAALGPNNEDYRNPSIHIFNDGSAIINLSMGKTRAFTTVQQALDFCKEAA